MPDYWARVKANPVQPYGLSCLAVKRLTPPVEGSANRGRRLCVTMSPRLRTSFRAAGLPQMGHVRYLRISEEVFVGSTFALIVAENWIDQGMSSLSYVCEKPLAILTLILRPWFYLICAGTAVIILQDRVEPLPLSPTPLITCFYVSEPFHSAPLGPEYKSA